MMSLTNTRTGRCARWCALVVMVAVCSLTIRVATRYGASTGSGISSVQAVHKISVHNPGRQRLDNNAASWMPPTFCAAMLDFPTAEACQSPELEVIPRLSYESNLYNRPPPFQFLS